MTELKVLNEQDICGKNFKIYGTVDEPLFLAKDIAELIEHSDVSTMLKMVDENEKLTQTLFVSGQNRKVWMVTEDGMYEILMKSDKPIAKELKSQIKVILKTIRKTGGFVANEDLFINTYLPFADDLTKQMFGGILATVRNQNETIAKQRDENIKLINRTETQHKLIDTMTESYDGTYIRMVSHDYINKACKQTNQSQSELYNKVYKLVGRSLKIDLDVQLKNFSNKERQIVKSNMEYNRENNLKGMDRKTPCFIKDSKAEISKLEFICNVLGRGIVVLESIAKVCEVGISEVVSKYNIIKETAKIKGDDYNV